MPNVSSQQTLNSGDHADKPELNREDRVAQNVREIIEAIAQEDRETLSRQAQELHTADFATLIDLLNPEQRLSLLELVGDQIPAAVFNEFDESVLEQISPHLSDAYIAAVIGALESDDALYILEHVAEARRGDILRRIPFFERFRIARSLDYPEACAGRMMQCNVVAVPVFWTVGHTIDYLRGSSDLPEHFVEIFIVDPSYHLVGTVALSLLLRMQRSVLLEKIMTSDQTLIPTTLHRDDIASLFRRYHLLSAAVVDENNRLVGMITVDDIVEVIDDKAEEDINHLGGVGEESLNDGIVEIASKRFYWLSLNLVTAISASLIIGLFDETLERLIALAILMPIIVSMGGNGGTQTLTVVVRALAMGELLTVNVMRITLRECLAGLLNGILFAIILGIITIFWFGSWELAAVMGIATVITMGTAALSGVLVPLGLKGLNLDPALASPVIVTTCADFIGFISFLGLAALYLF